MACVSHLPHVLANVLVGQAAALTAGDGRPSGCRPSGRASATRPASPAPTRAIWTDIYLSNRDALMDGDRRAARAPGAGARVARRRGDAGCARRVERAARARERDALLGAGLVGGPVQRAARVGAEPARRDRRDRARAGARRRQHRRHGAVALAGQPPGRDRAVDRAARSQAGRGAGADRRRSGSRSRAREARGRSTTVHNMRFEPAEGLCGLDPRAGRQVDLPPRRAARRDVLGAGPHRAATCTPPTPTRRSRRCARSARWSRSTATTSWCAAPGCARRASPTARSTSATPGTLLRLLPGWLAAQDGRSLHARRRRLDPPPAGGPHRRARCARWAPSWRRASGRFPPLQRARRAPARDHLRARRSPARRSSPACCWRRSPPTAPRRVIEPTRSRDHTERMLLARRRPDRPRGLAA